MGHLMFYLAVIGACLLWSAACTAAAARTDRLWLRRLLVAAAVLLPPLALLPWVGATAALAFVVKLETNWFAPTLTAFLAAVIGGLWLVRAGLSRQAAEGGFVAAGWPVIGLAAMFVAAKMVAFGTLLCIDNAVMAECQGLRAEAAQIMLAALPAQPAADDDAAPLYLQAYKLLKDDKVLERAARADDPKNPLHDLVTADVNAPEVADLLARHAATLALVRRAADKPGCRFVRDWSRPSIGTLLGETEAVRGVVRLLALAARREAATGNTAGALRDVVRIRRIADHAAAEPFVVCGLMSMTIDERALETLADVLPRLTPRDLPLLDDEPLRDLVATPLKLQRAFLGEEAFGLFTMADIGRQTMTIDNLVNMEIDPPAWSTPVLFLPVRLLYTCFLIPADIAGYRGIMAKYQRIAGEVVEPEDRPYPRVKEECDAIEADSQSRRKGLFAALMAPSLSSVVRRQVQITALHRAAEVLVAATRARLRDGAIPDSADALVPGHLPAVPRDPFTLDAALRSKREKDRFIFYSVGPDGEDDGGPLPPDADRDAANDDVGLQLATP